MILHEDRSHLRDAFLVGTGLLARESFLAKDDLYRTWEYANPHLPTEARILSEAGAPAGHVTIGESGAPASQAASAPAYRSDELALVNALSELEILDRQILALRYIGSIDAEQIGIELAMPSTAVLARVARILDRLLKDPRLAAAADVTVDEYERLFGGEPGA